MPINVMADDKDSLFVMTSLSDRPPQGVALEPYGVEQHYQGVETYGVDQVQHHHYQGVDQVHYQGVEPYGVGEPYGVEHGEYYLSSESLDHSTTSSTESNPNNIGELYLDSD